MNDEEGSDVLLRREPCPDCGSSDALARYSDGHGHCFKCNRHDPIDPKMSGKTGSESTAKKTKSRELISPGDNPGAYDPLNKRGLKSNTLKRYGYFLGGFKGSTVQIAQYQDQDGNLACQKIRLPGKDFPILKVEGAPSIGECKLFGQQSFGDKFDKRVVITEGELDAMSVGQANDFKFPCVSVNTGAQSAVKCLKANYRWIDRFDEIILWFDDDEAGHEASEECAKLFQVGKVKIARVEGSKDASDVLQSNRPGDIVQAIFAATSWRQKGIVNAADCLNDVLEDPDETGRVDYPWDKLNEMTRGAAPGEVIYHVAGTGIGKTTILYEIEHSAIQQGKKCGHMGFEDTRRDVQMGLLSVHLNRRVDDDPCITKDDLAAAHKELFGSRQVELFDPETAEWVIAAIIAYVRYMVKALDVQVIAIDPLSFIAANISAGEDERRALDKVSRDFARIGKELGVTLHITHHLSRPEGNKGHEEGAVISLKHLRGSGGIAQFANTVIGYERNQQGERPDLCQVRLLKNRRKGKTGVAGVLRYEQATGRYCETDEPYDQTDNKGETHEGSNGFGQDY